ncbi:MAG: hypothetical protein KC478_04180 [Bacteriovoracaceae bacterium]|nr:hypothetical protein [Bacteriovoracaceae bacterium]
MKLLICLSILVASVHAQKSYESFIVNVEDEKISVTSPEKKKKVVTIVVKNNSFDKIVSEIKSDSKVLKRFTLFPSGKKGSTYTLTVDYEKSGTVYYAPVAPPFQAVPLTFSKGSYEVP